VNFNLESGQGLNDGAFATACSRWTKLAMTRGTALDRPALLKKTFAQVDVDGSGSISQKEYMQLADNNDRVSLEMQKNVFRLADSSGDGILEEEEFVQFNLETGKELNDYDFAQQCRAWTFFARGRG
jgi:Ca2+-binding EF-hand superfamily protein